MRDKQSYSLTSVLADSNAISGLGGCLSSKRASTTEANEQSHPINLAAAAPMAPTPLQLTPMPCSVPYQLCLKAVTSCRSEYLSRPPMTYHELPRAYTQPRKAGAPGPRRYTGLLIGLACKSPQG